EIQFPQVLQRVLTWFSHCLYLELRHAPHVSLGSFPIRSAGKGSRSCFAVFSSTGGVSFGGCGDLRGAVQPGSVRGDVRGGGAGGPVHRVGAGGVREQRAAAAHEGEHPRVLRVRDRQAIQIRREPVTPHLRGRQLRGPGCDQRINTRLPRRFGGLFLGEDLRGGLGVDRHQPHGGPHLGGGQARDHAAPPIREVRRGSVVTRASTGSRSASRSTVTAYPAAASWWAWAVRAAMSSASKIVAVV